MSSPGTSPERLVDPLDALARQFGINAAYTDVFGVSHLVSLETRDALLTAVGFDAAAYGAGVNAAAQRLLEDFERERWTTPLPPAIVVTCDDGHVEVHVPLAAALAMRPLLWRLVLEDGDERAGEANQRETTDARTTVNGVEMLRTVLVLTDVPHGYHRLSIETPSGASSTTHLIVCPSRCFTPDDIAPGLRLWGPAIQLYAVRSMRNWGIGDFGDLRTLVHTMAHAGAGFVGLNPLHALHIGQPSAASPYSPSDRTRLNVLMIDITALHELSECVEVRERVESAAFQARLGELRGADMVDYDGVAAVKLPILAQLHRYFVEQHEARSSELARQFARWRAAAGAFVEKLALFDAIDAQQRGRGVRSADWRNWPGALADHASDEVARFAREHADELGFAMWMQWHADSQLADAAAEARRSGMTLGLYRDLAVGVAADGAETWAAPRTFAAGVRVGCPSDRNNPQGQDWGLPPLLPKRLIDTAYRPFIATLRANMRHAGALRIDHVMALMRLFWIPPSGTARQGIYVSYPMDDMAAIVALESRRARCVVVGEDLGTVPQEIRDMMRARGLLSYRPLYFTRDAEGRFGAPSSIARDALVTIGTHDLPTWDGFWRSNDLGVRDRLQLWPTPERAQSARADRAVNQAGIRRALADADLGDSDAAHGSQPDIADALAFIARAPSALAAFQMEDVFGQVEQINLPSTTEVVYPNWRRKLGVPLEAWIDDERLARVTNAIRRERGAAPGTERARQTIVVPRATYRLQLHAGFDFAAATRVLPYLKTLGISHVYVSPLTQARPGSKHGYDVIDHGRLNPELGTEEDFAAWCEALHTLGLGQILDIVPNHMAVLGARNPWWHDVLMHGAGSRFAQHFDIDGLGAPNPDAPLQSKVLLPILGDQYGTVLERGEIEMQFDRASGEFQIAYFEHRIPLDPRTIPVAPDAGVDAAVCAINADPSALHALLEAQPYRLAHWRVAADDINYRRFFDINDLAGVRVESPQVFDDVHRLVFRWLRQGCVDGLRIDHPDGLADPAKYFHALQARAGAARAGDTPLYVVVEKILAPHEALPDWPVHGETGYHFAFLINALFVDSRAADRFTRIYAGFTDGHAPYGEVLASAKHQVLAQSLASEFTRLAGLAHDVALSQPHTRDFTLNTLRAALAEVIAAFPVYRSYIAEGAASDEDVRHIDRAIMLARKRARGIDGSVFDFLRAILLSETKTAGAEKFVARFQQVTAPVTAKAMEDTSFYRYLRLVSLNEVGSDPGTFGISLATFHRAMSERRARWPHALSATSTHDTKRSEDVRARIDVLSEMPVRWRFVLRRFARMNARHKTQLAVGVAPSSNDEYLLYQTLIGTWPGKRPNGQALEEYRCRIAAYMCKAAREAKLHTGWVTPDVEYETALERFVERLLADSPRNRFLDVLDAEARVVARFGASNSLAQVLIKCTAPGIPDFYQGCENWNLRLVDPDNRQPVDFAANQRLLDTLTRTGGEIRQRVKNSDVGGSKLWVMQRALQVRADQPQLFAEGDYAALQAQGVLEEHVIAFSRTHAGKAAVVLATRWPLLLAGSPDGTFVGKAWRETEVALPQLPANWRWTDAMTNDVHAAHDRAPVARLLSHLPVALLVAERSDTS